MGLLGWVWDINQDRGIREAHDAARHAGSSAHSAQSELADLRASVDRLMLVNRALWELIRDQSALREEDLLARIEAIDMRDGVLDGRMGLKSRSVQPVNGLTGPSALAVSTVARACRAAGLPRHFLRRVNNHFRRNVV
jgi:hypothetical protein